MRQLCFVLSLSGLRFLGLATEPSIGTGHIHRITGEPTRIGRARTPPHDLTVVTWNIDHGGAFEGVLSALRALDPDVVLLQEVDQDCRRSKYRHVAKDLATALDMNWVAAGEFQEIGEGRGGIPAITGQAILSKFTIHDAKALPFRAQAHWRWLLNPVQPRRGGRLALEALTGGVIFYNTHIESGGDERLQQRQMREIVAHQAGAGDLAPTVIAGDFNNRPVARSLTLGSLVSASFVDALGDAAERGSTSRGQRGPIDWIFVRHMGTTNGHVVRGPKASDHSPVISMLRARQP